MWRNAEPRPNGSAASSRRGGKLFEMPTAPELGSCLGVREPAGKRPHRRPVRAGHALGTLGALPARRASIGRLTPSPYRVLARDLTADPRKRGPSDCRSRRPAMEALLGGRATSWKAAHGPSHGRPSRDGNRHFGMRRAGHHRARPRLSTSRSVRLRDGTRTGRAGAVRPLILRRLRPTLGAAQVGGHR